MFGSLVDQRVEPTIIEMIRLRQSLTVTALEAYEFQTQSTKKPKKFSSLNLVVREETYRPIWSRSKR